MSEPSPLGIWQVIFAVRRRWVAASGWCGRASLPWVRPISTRVSFALLLCCLLIKTHAAAPVRAGNGRKGSTNTSAHFFLFSISHFSLLRCDGITFHISAYTQDPRLCWLKTRMLTFASIQDASRLIWGADISHNGKIISCSICALNAKCYALYIENHIQDM